MRGEAHHWIHIAYKVPWHGLAWLHWLPQQRQQMPHYRPQVLGQRQQMPQQRQHVPQQRQQMPHHQIARSAGATEAPAHSPPLPTEGWPWAPRQLPAVGHTLLIKGWKLEVRQRLPR